MTCVSSHAKTFRKVEVPVARAAQTSARLVIDFEPGGVISPIIGFEESLQ
jgi:hypothetical protein